MANCPEVGITYDAVWRAGAVATPVLFLLSEDELRHVLTDSGAVLVVTTPEFLPKVRPRRPACRACARSWSSGESSGPAARGANRRHRRCCRSRSWSRRRGRAGRHRPGRAGRAALHRRHDRPVEGRDAQPRRAVGGGLGGDGRRPTTALSSALLPLPLSHVYGLMVSVMSLHAPARDLGADALVRPGRLAAARAGAPGQRQPAGALDAADAAGAAARGLRPVRAAAARQRQRAAAAAGRRRTWTAAPARRDRRGLRLHRDRRDHLDLPDRPGAGAAASGGRRRASRCASSGRTAPRPGPARTARSACAGRR